MNYSQATNKELTARLMDLQGLPKQVDSLGVWLDEGFCEDSGACQYTFMDYCSNWNLTMPLAVQYGVTPILDDGYGFATNDPYEVYEPHGKNKSDGFFQVSMDEETPLRAIVICLIKVMEFKNGN